MLNLKRQINQQKIHVWEKKFEEKFLKTGKYIWIIWNYILVLFSQLKVVGLSRIRRSPKKDPSVSGFYL